MAAALGLAALYTLGGLYAIRPGEAGVERRFGRIVRQAPPGLHYRLPWPWGRVDRVAVDLTRTMEIGFRTGLPAAAEPSGVAATTTTPAGNEPAAYEWNTRHTIGRYEKNMDEAVMLTGDENLVEATLVAHYRVSDAALFLASASDAEGLLRACAESAVRSAIAERPLMDALAADRRAIEQLALQRLRAGIGEFHLGVELLEVRLQDIHPPLETVENFRAVSSAFEEKHRLVNEAEAYAAERKELAQGEAAQLREAAQAYSVEKVSRAQGEAGKFDMLSAAFAKAGPVAALRQYLETVQTALAPLRKIIIDSPTAPGQAQARAHLYLYDESAFKPILDALAAQAAAPPAYYPLPNPDSMD
ncbi:MAG: Modulator of FtsH protease HflK [candidate division BRC1 bacterium ADurb.BinA364]|nr:MAG: Modulator of FtsH protease HflK [candidate division BRC1 bacterium ADurb.BinA364]